MARPSRPWFRESRGQWFVTVAGKQVPLGVTDPTAEDAAVAAFRELLRKSQRAEPPGSGLTVAKAVETFLAGRRGTVRPKTFSGYRWYTKTITARYGSIAVNALDPGDVERWAAKQPWSQSTRRNLLATLESVLKDAGRAVRFRKPPGESAGADSVIPEPVYLQVLGAARPDFRPLVRFLWLTGCRQCEAIGLTAADIDLAAGVARLRDHKTKGRTGKVRFIYLPAEALAVVRERIGLYPEGHLFRSAAGKPYSQMGVVKRFLTISRRIGRRVTAHCFRHSLATRALTAGVPEAHVAALLGHTSTAMVSRHYGHLTTQTGALRDAAEKANRQAS